MQSCTNNTFVLWALQCPCHNYPNIFSCAGREPINRCHFAVPTIACSKSNRFCSFPLLWNTRGLHGGKRDYYIRKLRRSRLDTLFHLSFICSNFSPSHEMAIFGIRTQQRGFHLSCLLLGQLVCPKEVHDILIDFSSNPYAGVCLSLVHLCCPFGRL